MEIVGGKLGCEVVKKYQGGGGMVLGGKGSLGVVVLVGGLTGC